MAPGETDDSEILSKAIRNYKHSTWARTMHSYPSLYFEPTTTHEVQQIVNLARHHRRRIVTVGAGHSPSDLTCTSSILVSLKKLDRILHVQKQDDRQARVTCQAGISLHELSERLSKSDGLIIPNLGSIDVQSVAGALATGTHGSSLRHGLLYENVYSLRICLADGTIVKCSADERVELFRSALVSLGALGIIVEVELRMVPTCNIEWTQDLVPVASVLDAWDKGHWTQREFIRCWWLPYQRNMIVWKADKTAQPVRKPRSLFTAGMLGFYFYKTLLWIANYFPRVLPRVEWLMFGLQARFTPGHVASAVEEQREGLLMDCLFSQLVNEWALPLHKGPEAISRLEKWLHNDKEGSKIPFDPQGVFVHYPIEVRVTDNSSPRSPPRGYLDNTMPDGPTLYLNATLYRPFGLDPPSTQRYYEAFEWLMKEMGGRPHWAKNFQTVTHQDFQGMYRENLKAWVDTRQRVDPEGMFVGAWHRRTVLGSGTPVMACEEAEKRRMPVKEGGYLWEGLSKADVRMEKEVKVEVRTRKSEESFDSVGGSTESEGVVSLSEEGEKTPEG